MSAKPFFTTVARSFFFIGCILVSSAPSEAREKPQAFYLLPQGEGVCNSLRECGSSAKVATWGSPTANVFDATRPTARPLSSFKLGNRELDYADFKRLAEQTIETSGPRYNSVKKWLCGSVTLDSGQLYKAQAYTVGSTGLPLLVSDPSDCLCAKPGRVIPIPQPQPGPGEIDIVPSPRPRPRLVP